MDKGGPPAPQLPSPLPKAPVGVAPITTSGNSTDQLVAQNQMLQAQVQQMMHQMQSQQQLMQQMMQTQVATMSPGLPAAAATVLGYNPMFPSVFPPGLGLMPPPQQMMPPPGVLLKAPGAEAMTEHRAHPNEDRASDKSKDDKERKEKKDRDRDRDKESKKDPKDRR